MKKMFSIARSNQPLMEMEKNLLSRYTIDIRSQNQECAL